MKKIVYFSGLVLLIFCNRIVHAEEETTIVSDAQARGFLAITRNETSIAKQWFIRAAETAVVMGDWRGTVEAAGSLATLGAHREAIDNLRLAEKLVQKNKDWQPSLAVAYVYAGLPREMGKLKDSARIMTIARKKAEKQKDWHGIIETGRGFLMIGEKTRAAKCFEKAEKIVNRIKNPQAYSALSRSFNDAGDEEKSEKYIQLAIENMPEEERNRIMAQVVSAVSPGKVRKKGPPPPPEWSPYDDSLAQPGEIDPSAKTMLQQHASEQLNEAEQQILIQQYEDSFRKSSRYSGYFFYYPRDYLYRIWDRHITFDLQSWALWNLRRFHLVDGIYLYQ